MSPTVQHGEHPCFVGCTCWVRLRRFAHLLGFLAQLDSVAVGEIEQTQVRATISPGLATREVLLGMSFLKHLELVQKGDTLTLRQ